MELDNKVAIVTGGAVRLGRALALALAEQGARLVIHYNSSAGPAEEILAQIKALSDGIAVQADLRQVSKVQAIITHAVEHFGQVDVLINSAAIFEPGGIADTTEADWDSHFKTNLKAPFFLCQAFAAQVGKEQPGHIINIADWRATRPRANFLAYTLTKAALITMTYSLAQALAPNIQVNAIAPGLILPPPGKDQAYLEQMARTIPAHQAGSPDDIAKTMLFLLGSDFITGELIFVTGGEHL
jgi:pteridine reductase